MTKQLGRTGSSRWLMLALAVVGLGLGTWIAPEIAQAVSGGSPSGRFKFTKGTDPFTYAGNGLTAISGRSCTINKASSTSCLLINYYENVSSSHPKTNTPFRYSSIHLYLNGVHVSGRQIYVPDPLHDTPFAMATAITGGAPGAYTVQVFAAGSQPLNFGGQDVNIGQPLDYTITIQEIP